MGGDIHQFFNLPALLKASAWQAGSSILFIKHGRKYF
jgi:hypothetical protein